MQINDPDTGYAPFYVGQKVIGSDFAGEVGSGIKKGKQYIITACHYSYCSNGNNFYWYCGISHNPRENWLTPKLFSPIEENFQAITFEKINELEVVSEN